MNKQTQTNWVDFKALKQKLAIADVLQRFGVELESTSGVQLYGRCPLPQHAGDRDNATAFSVNTEKHCWRCITHCGAGNALELYALFSGKNPKDKAEFREVALEVQEWINGDIVSNDPVVVKPIKVDIAVAPPTPNKVLNFVIPTKVDIPFLTDEKQFPVALLEEFGIGWASKGMFSGRIVVPIHNINSELVGYAGRGIKDTDIAKKGRWRFPSQFSKGMELFNWHRLDLELVKKKGIIIVEGFWSALRWHQAGCPVVALMGRELTETQRKLIAGHARCVWLMLDNDEAGKEAAVKIAHTLAHFVFVKIINYPSGDESDNRVQPEDFTPDKLLGLIRG